MPASATLTPGKYNVWIPPANLGSIATNNPGVTFTNGAFVAWNTLQEAQADVTANNMGVILDPAGAYDPNQVWSGASSFQASLPTAPVVLNPTTPSAPATVSPSGDPIATTPAAINYTPLKGLPPLSDYTSPIASGAADIEAIFTEKVGNGMRVALRFRSKNPGEYPNDLQLKLTQTATGAAIIKSFSEIIKPVDPTSTVSEGEFTVDYAEFAAQAVATGSAMGLYAKWNASGHDRDFSENVLYQFKAP